MSISSGSAPMDARALRAASRSDPAEVPAIVARAAAGFGATDVVIYLVDFGQTVLAPLPDHAPHAGAPETEPLASMAGRAFDEQRVVTAARDDGVRVWSPLLEGSECTGVVALTVAAIDDAVLQAITDLALLAGYLMVAQARYTDVYNLYRRRRSMKLAAAMQWDLLPPLVMIAGPVRVAGFLEPAYDVGGDCFDYAANGSVLDFAVMDAMGHDLQSAMIAALAVGCYRHDRREAQSLVAMHENLAALLSGYFRDGSFATGVLGRLDTETGALTWTNAGHPLPLLLRNRRVIKELVCPPTPPWGTIAAAPQLATEQLEPGDSVVLYTDGVTEARGPNGVSFGVDRLIDLVERHAADELRPDQTVRGLVRSVHEHRGRDLADDATIVMARWR